MWCLSVIDAITDDIISVTLTESVDEILDFLEIYLDSESGYEYILRFVEKVEVTKNGKC